MSQHEKRTRFILNWVDDQTLSYTFGDVGEFTYLGRPFNRDIADVCVVAFLDRLTFDFRTQPEQRNMGWLLPFREDFRRILRRAPIAGLIWCLAHGPDEEKRLAVWLLGRCGGSAHIPFLARFKSAKWRPLRKAAVQALVRHGARRDLVDVTPAETDPVICRLIAARGPHAFEDRLAQYLHSVPPIPEPPRRTLRQFWFREPLGPGKPAKSTTFIRRLLDRIRQAIRGTRADANAQPKPPARTP